MNDSFLEDLELVGVEQKAGSTVHHAERHITRRRSQPSPIHPSPDQEELNILMAKQNPRQKISPTIAESKISNRKSVDSATSNKEARRPSSRENKTENAKSRVPDRRSKPPEIKLKLVENNVENQEGPKAKIERKDRPRWSAGSNKESSRCSDGSSKENSRPSDSSKESVTHAETPRDQRSRGSGDGPARRRDAEEKFEVAMLNSVKEIVSTYTKSESTKILRAMQELYINSQSNLIKLILQQTDDLTSDAGKDSSPRLRSLVDENERLKENIAFLETRNEELRKIVEEHEQIKQENLQLKKLLKSGAAKENNRCSAGSSKENNSPSNTSKETASPKTRARQIMEICRNPK